MDLKHHKVFDVVLGRSQPSLHRYLSQLQGKDRVKYIVIDLSETYRSIIQRYFPNAKIISDRFHVVRLVNQHFMQLWQQQDPIGRKSRGLISLMRRHQWKLKNEQRMKLEAYLEQYPVLHALYRVKQRLNRLMLLKNIKSKKARKRIPQLLQLIGQLQESPAHALARTLQSWIEPNYTNVALIKI